MDDTAPVALVTGAAHRLGAKTAQTLHDRGWNLVIHYRSQHEKAEALAGDLNQTRPGSAFTLQADLSNLAEVQQLAEQSVAQWGRLDGLVNNASVFYPNPTEQEIRHALDGNLCRCTGYVNIVRAVAHASRQP